MAFTNPSNLTALTARDIRATFIETYNEAQADMDPRLSGVMSLANPSDKLAELYGYRETRPYPAYWEKGEEIPRGAFRGVTYEVYNHRFARAIDWYYEDEEDDQLGGTFADVMDLAEHYAIHPERIFFQFLGNGTDRELMPYVPNAPDGAALFATTAGGADRFGVSGGNIVTGTGVASASTIRTDFYSTLVRYAQMQDPQGQPLWRPGTLSRGVTIVYGVANEEVFTEAFVQRVVHSVSSSTGAGVENIVLSSGVNLTLWSTPRITDNDWYVILNGTRIKPIFEQVREPVNDNLADFENSDITRSQGVRSYQVRARMGYGINLPYAAVQVNNA